MAYGRKSYSTSRRRYPGRRRTTRKTRSRFSRKRFTKYSSKQKTVVKGTVNARETYVKLPWVNTFASTSLTTGTSSSRSFLGNSLVPFPAAYNTGTPAAGDEWVAGVAQYASFYDRYRVLGSSIKVQILCQTSSGVTFGVVLVPVTVSNASSVAASITELDALNYDQLCMLPNTQCRIIGIGSGGNANVFMKAFRKSKQMLACKDIKDNDETDASLPSTAGAGGAIIVIGSNAWFWYVRVLNISGSTGSFDMQVKTKHYCQLFARQLWTPVAVPE